MTELVLQGAAQAAFAVLVTLVTAYFAIHAVQHVESPAERAGWLLIIVPFTLLGAAFYASTKYRAFWKIGKGGLIRDRPAKSWHSFLRLSESEMKVRRSASR